jgi:glucose/arabinose dehydrogenase
MDLSTRRQFLGTTGLALAALAGCSSDAPGSTDDGGLELVGSAVADGFASPVDVTVPAPNEYYVVDQFGTVALVDGAGAEPETAVDLTDRMADPGGEMGLLGMAVHPDYDGAGRAYLRYSAPPRPGTPDGFSHTFVLSEFELTTGAIGPDSERTLLEIPQPQANHNAGAVAFGPDGSLYVGVGDGGGANDQGRGHVSDWYDEVEGGNGQDITENLLGSVLRLDVDDRSGDRPYAIPDDNPLVGRAGLDEQYAWGFRNPWRLSFGPDGRLFVADVGQSSYEEVNVVERGGNYGWNVREGAGCFRAQECPTTGPDGTPLVDPVIEYPHDGGEVSGISVIGGHVYEGEAIPSLRGRYVFGDFRARGRLFVATEGEDEWTTTTAPIDGIGSNVLSFGTTADGELLVCSTDSVDGDSGGVHRIEPA